MIETGLIAAAGMLFLLFKFGVRKVIHYDILFDVLITALLMYALAGTYGGMKAAHTGGLIVSIVLFIMKRTPPGRQKLSVVRVSKFPYRKIKWVTV